MQNIETRSYDARPDFVFQSLLNAVEDVGMKIKKMEEPVRRLEVTTGASAWSWGEKIELIVSDSDGNSVVNAKAKPRLFYNITANLKEPINKIFEALERRLNDSQKI